jgi:hypothetical protein
VRTSRSGLPESEALALLEGEYLAKIARAGFTDVEVTWRGQPFAGASGQRKVDKFETEGVNIRARKP